MKWGSLAWGNEKGKFEGTTSIPAEYDRELHQRRAEQQKRMYELKMKDQAAMDEADRKAKRNAEIEQMARQIYANMFCQPGIGIFTDEEIHTKALTHAQNYFEALK